MFIYNFKLNKSKLSKLFIVTSLLIITLILAISIYIIFIKPNNNASNKTYEIIELNENNYTDILKTANENIDSFVGMKFHIIGYIYRLLDFKKNEFVIARDMQIGNKSQYLVVGFLCNYNKASDFTDGTWVEITGQIKKGMFNNTDIAILSVLSIKKCTPPDNVFVNPPSNTFIPTSNMIFQKKNRP